MLDVLQMEIVTNTAINIHLNISQSVLYKIKMYINYLIVKWKNIIVTIIFTIIITN